MDKSHNPRIRKFNPGTLQSDEEVISQFVVRTHQLGTVLEALRGNVDSPSCQHALLVAPRGRGKSMLLARVAAELRTNGTLSRSLLPVRFMEESQEIFNIADFWLETLFYLAREIETADPGLSEELQMTHADLASRWSERATGEHACTAVLSAADRLGKKLVLMVENLQALCADVDPDFDWQLRKVLQSEPQLMLLATATSRFDGLDDATQPFFELFRIIDLKPLNTEECLRLWHMISGDTVSEREIRPLEILTGGSPRLLVIVGEFARHQSLRQLMEGLVKLVDDHTEYFRGHLDSFAKSERRVYLAVIDLWQPSTTAQIAARARMDIRTVSALLGRLVEQGVVIVDKSQRKRRYATAERLYSIYYKLRRQRDEAAVVHHLISFMAVFYHGDQLAELSGKLRLEARESLTIYEGIQRAIVEAPHLAKAIGFKEIVGADEEAESFRGSVSAARDLLNRGITEDQLGQPEAAIATYNEVIELFGRSDTPELQTLVARALVNKGVRQGQLGQSEKEIVTYDRVIELFGGSDAPGLQVYLAVALVFKGLTQGEIGEHDTAIASFDKAVELFGDRDAPEHQVFVAAALACKGMTQGQIGEFEMATANFDKAVELFGDREAAKLQKLIAAILLFKGMAQGRNGEHEASISTCDQIIERFGRSDAPDLQEQVAGALVFKGMTQDRIGETEKAIATYNEVVELLGDSDSPELQKEVAEALVLKSEKQVEIGRTAEALDACGDLEGRFGVLAFEPDISFDWCAKRIRTKALLAQDDCPAAVEAFGQMYASLNPGNERIMQDIVMLAIDMIAAGASASHLVEILSSNTSKAETLEPLVVALHELTGDFVSAPAEILDVAADIRKAIAAKRSHSGSE